MYSRAICEFLVLFVLLLSTGISRPKLPGLLGIQEKIAVLPFEIQGISVEEGLKLTQCFGEALSKSKRFEVMHPDTMMNIFAEAGVKTLEGCNYSYCLADLGKVLGVQKVIHASAARRGKLYVLRIRLVNVADAQIVYDEKVEHSGEFTTLAGDVVPEQARRLAEPQLETGTKWYFIAAAILVGVGAIYMIYRTFNKNLGEESSDSGAPPTPQ